MTIRKAVLSDIRAVSGIYDAIHTAEEAGQATIGWVRGVYPTEKTAAAALERGDLFVLEDAGVVCGSAIINQIQCDGYETANWQYPARSSEMMVLHTLTIAPHAAGQGYGKAFVGFYEEYARMQGCRYLRMDTNEKNIRARAMYQKMGYREIGVISTTFNSIEGVNLVLLEKALEDESPADREKGATAMTKEMNALLVERFAKDSLIALATTDGLTPSVRTVNACYMDGAFYCVTYAKSNKVQQIARNPVVGLCGEWFSGHGRARSLGHVLLESNRARMEILRPAFAAWYSNGHVDESDSDTILLEITLTDGVLMKQGQRFFFPE